MISADEIVSVSFADNLATVNQRDVVAKIFRLAHHVSREDDAFSPTAFLFDELHQKRRADDIEGGGDFIQNEDFRIVEDRVRNQGPLLLPRREIAETAIAKRCHVEVRDELLIRRLSATGSIWRRRQKIWRFSRTDLS